MSAASFYFKKKILLSFAESKIVTSIEMIVMSQAYQNHALQMCTMPNRKALK